MWINVYHNICPRFSICFHNDNDGIVGWCVFSIDLSKKNTFSIDIKIIFFLFESQYFHGPIKTLSVDLLIFICM